MAYPKGFILITSIVLMFVCSSIIFAYFMRISHEYQRVEINIAQAKAKYNALSGFAFEAYEDMFLRDFIPPLENGEPADSIKYYLGSKELDLKDYEWFNCPKENRAKECMGDFDSISVRIRKSDGQLVRHGYALGIAYYKNIINKTLTLTDSVDITTNPLPSLNKFMYLTDDELAGGAPQIMYNGARGTVSFRDDDEFDGANGDFQTNGTLVTNGPPNCPEFESTVTLTYNSEGEINEPDLNGCDFDDVFTGDPQTDTSAAICLPPPNFDQKKHFADYIFDATELLVSDGLSYPGGFQRDTLIMTELEFFSGGGFRVSRYKYLMPPHLDMNLTQANTPNSPTGNHLETNGLGTGLCNGLMPLVNCNQYEQALNRYHAKTRAVLNNNDDVYIDPDVREAHGVHHFDTHLFQYDPENNSEFEPAGISTNSTAITTNSYYPSEPTAIYIKGGPVLVHGTFKGRYTVITDEIMTYRRHAYPVNNAIETPIDTIYCNIWLVGDLINADRNWDGDHARLDDEGVQPTEDCEGGSDNLMGLVSGANVIIANTRANGAGGGTTFNGDLNINIHAHMIAFNESVTIQYWQNSISSWITNLNQDGYWNDWNANSNSWGSTPTFLADGNGNRYGALTGSDDDRGNVYLWGGFVQLFRGYMFRNASGPYNISPGIGMDKHYFWDDNMRCNNLPLYPEKIDCDDSAGPPQYDYGIAQFRIF